MTDNYGTESNGEHGHDEVLTPEHDPVREPPSDYEFADEHGASAAEEHTEETVAATDAKPAGRSPLLPIMAAVGVLLLGGAAWWQFGGNSSPAIPPLSVPPAMPEVMQKTDAAPVVPANMAAPAAPVPLPVNPAPVLSAAPAPVPTTPAELVAAAMPAPAAPAPAMPMAVPAMAPAPVAAAPTAPTPMMPTAMTPGETPDQRIQALNARVDALQKSLDQANQQLGQVSNMVAANTSTAAPSVKDLQDRIDKLEQEAAQAHGAAPTLAAPASTSGDVIAVAPPAPKHAEHHKTTHIATVAHKKEAKKPAAVPAPSWVLRSASPGQAWVAVSATAHDLQHVQTGDTLDGIGKVTAIDQQNGNWVVHGTKGQIQ